jgi:hypothetical protein
MFDVKYGSGGSKYCGPAAVSIITGCDTKQASIVIRSIYGRQRVKGTWPREVVRTLETFGCVVTKVDKRLKTASFSGVTTHHLLVVKTKGNTYHWVVVKDGKYCCSCYPTVRSIEHWSVPNYPTVEAYEVIVPRTITQPTAIQEAKNAQKDRNLRNANWRVLRDTAKAHGVDVERTNDSYIVWRPDRVEEANDPYSDKHYHDSVVDALKAVEEYATLSLHSQDK